MFIPGRKIRVFLVLSAVFLLLTNTRVSGSGFAQARRFQSSVSLKTAYGAGLRQLKAGRWQAAVHTWEQALGRQESRQSVEPKMAIHYIRTVTEHEDTARYQEACKYYLDFLREANWTREPHAMKEEFRRVLPIAPPRLRKVWKKEIDNENPAIFGQMVAFWVSRDPVLSTSLNERLIEHWRRIAYARKHFRRAGNTVYGTDDRGLIYVRFGKPDRREEKIVTPPNLINDPVHGGPLIVDGRIIHPIIPLIMDVELWEYTFSNRQKPSYYLFGEDAKGGGYGLQPGVMQMIPTFGYSLPAAGMDRQGGALMLKYSIVEKLIGTTGYFVTLYNKLTNAIIERSVNRNAGAAVFQAPAILHHFEFWEAEQARRRDRESPGSTTDLITGSNLIKTEYHYFRYLNRKNETEYLLVVDPDLKRLYRRLEPKRREKHPLTSVTMKSTFLATRDPRVRHVLAARNFGLHQIRSTGGVVTWFFNPDTTGASPVTGIDIFGRNGKHMKHDHIKYGRMELLYSTGPMQLPLPDPLKWNDKQILVSDPILGYQQTVTATKRIPFSPTLNPVFTNGDEMLVFFEIYDRIPGNYSIEFSYGRYQNSLLMRSSKPYNENADVTVLYRQPDRRGRHWLALELSDFAEGSYYVKMTVRDDKGTVQDIRTADFRITEKPFKKRSGMSK